MESSNTEKSPKATPARCPSAAGSASRLKDKSLIEPRPPLTRISYREGSSIFDPVDSPPLHSSTPAPRKRKMSSDSDSADGKRRRGKGDASLLREITALIKGSEERTVGRFDEKIDELTDKLTKRLDANEKEVKKLGRNVKEVWKTEFVTPIPKSNHGRRPQEHFLYHAFQ